MSLRSTIYNIAQEAVRSVRLPFRGRLTGLDNENRVQLMQVEGFAGELLQAVEFMEHFGFTSSPPTGTQCIMLPLGGKTTHCIVIATEHGDCRVVVEHGETCVYNEWGAKITLKKDKIIEVDCDHFVVNAKKSVCIDTENLVVGARKGASYLSPSLHFGSTNEEKATATMDADIKQRGELTTTKDVIAAGVSLMGHIHKENDHEGHTDAPIAKAKNADKKEVDKLTPNYDVTPTKPLVLFIGGALDSQTDNMRYTCERYAEGYNTNGELRSSYQDIRYGHHDQKEKFFPLMRQYYGAGKPIVVVGHSWGGGTAAAYLPRENHPGGFPIDLIVTLDPVALNWPGAENKKFTKRWVNVYVNPELTEFSFNNFVGRLGRRWRARQEADLNIDINTFSTKYNHADSYNMLFVSGVYREVEAIR